MDVTLNEVIEISEKADDGVDKEGPREIHEGEQTSEMPENGNTTQSGSGYHYQIRNTDGSQVYRVVQVGGDENNQQATLSIVTTNGILNQLSQDESTGGGAQQVAIVGAPFNNESSNETAVAAPDNGSTTSSQSDQLLSSGQFYVMMSPQEMMPAGGTPSRILGRASFQSRGDESSKNTRDDTRRVQHNEVERRRRDKINTWIMKLATMIPDCANDHTKQGQSKGGILAKACDYISELQHANTQLAESLKDYEQLQINYEMARQQIEETSQHLEEANQKVQLMTQTLQANQIDIPQQQQQQQQQPTQ